jgi:hypothetical protein
VPTCSSKGKDDNFTAIPKRVVEQAVGEQGDRSPLGHKHQAKIRQRWRGESLAALVARRGLRLSVRKRTAVVRKGAAARRSNP